MIVSQGAYLSPFELKALIIMGGDPHATMSASSDTFPASRGLHMIARYMAPLQAYYEDWHGRVLQAAANHGAYRRAHMRTHAEEVTDAMDDASAEFNDAWGLVPVSKAHHNRYAGGATLRGEASRTARMQAQARTGVGAQAAHTGSDMFKIKYDDIRKFNDTIIQFFAAQGMTSADGIGSAVNYSGQAMAIRSQNRQYVENLARFNESKRNQAAQDDANDSSGMGKLVSAGLSIASLFI